MFLVYQRNDTRIWILKPTNPNNMLVCWKVPCVFWKKNHQYDTSYCQKQYQQTFSHVQRHKSCASGKISPNLSLK